MGLTFPCSRFKNDRMKSLFIHVGCLAVATFIVSTPRFLRAADPAADFVEHISALTNSKQGVPLKLKNSDAATTKATFKPPVEIVIEAKTNSTNLRMSYAADDVIFNWENNKNQLRIDGGPASGKHKSGAGLIPINKYVTVRWLVTPKKQSIFVDGQLRFEDAGDYSMIDNPVSVFPAASSEVTVKSIKVKQLPAATQ